MAIFDSLSCTICANPFVGKTDDQRTPRLLLCGRAACDQCVKNEQKLPSANRRHKCTHGDRCFSRNNPAYCLIQILKMRGVIFSADRQGYILERRISSPICPVCNEEYEANDGDKGVFDLECNHTLCNECFIKRRQPIDGKEWSIDCPICQRCATHNTNTRLNPIKNFIRELPAMLRQLGEEDDEETSESDDDEEIPIRRNFRDLFDEGDEISLHLADDEDEEGLKICAHCEGEKSLESMHECNRCRIKICSDCCIRKHKDHIGDVISLLEKQLKDMAISTRDEMAISFNTRDMLPELHRQFLEKITILQGLLNDQADNLPTSMTMREAKRIQADCRIKAERFEEAVEEYIRDLRNFDTKIEKIVQDIH